MVYEKNDLNNTFTIKDTITSHDAYLSNIGDHFIYTINSISDLVKFTKFSDTINNEKSDRFVERFWRLSYNDCHYSDWYDLPLFNNDGDDDTIVNGNFPIFPQSSEKNISEVFTDFPQLSSLLNYKLEIKWVRRGEDPSGTLLIKDFELEGIYNKHELSTPVAKISSDISDRNPIYIKLSDNLKVFKLEDVEIVTSGENNNRKLEIEFRVSQDNFRTSTPWEKLNTENVKTLMSQHKISPIRFFWIEYKIYRSGTDLDGTVSLHDINLIGEIQNVSNDYLKTNLVGIRECCQNQNRTYLARYMGEGIPGFVKDDNVYINENFGEEEEELPENLANPLSNDIIKNLWNPYNLNKAVDLYNSLSNSTNEMFGWKVSYFLTAPDKKGIDHSFHEYQLKNVIDENEMKITVDQNQFPDNQIMFNQFDLSLFESFEVHIMKDQFKRMFGVTKRPSKDDFLWFCDLNRMYQVEHSQPYRDFNNSAVFYKVILKKYNQKASVQGADETIQSRIEQLTKNSTIDELFGLEVADDKKRVTKKVQHTPLSKDKVRYSFSANITRELIQNSSLIINKYFYDLSSIQMGDIAIRYSKVDDVLNKGENRSFSFWFRIPEYVINERYNFLNNHDGNKGYKVDLYNGSFNILLNDEIIYIPVDISDDIWYCVTVSINNRQHKLEFDLYKRNVDLEKDASKLKSSKLRNETSFETDIAPYSFDLSDIDHEINIEGSNMHLTNIRIFKDVMNRNSHNKVLNQNIIRDSEYLILADNSNKKINLDNFPYN